METTPERAWRPPAAVLTSIPITPNDDDFESRVAARRSLAGLSKQERVRDVLQHAPVVFRLRDVRTALPGVSDQTIRLVLSGLRREGLIAIDEAAGRNGPRAAWRRISGK